MDRSFEMHRTYREAQDRFEHFVLAALLAICAYLGQTNPYAPFGLNIPTIYFFCLASFVLSAIFGFKRIEYTIVLYRINHQLLDAREKSDDDKATDAIKALEEVGTKAKQYYSFRNIFMFIGLGSFLLAKYWAVYT